MSTKEEAIESEYKTVCNALGQNAVHREELLFRAQQLRQEAFQLQSKKGAKDEILDKGAGDEMRGGSDLQPEASDSGQSADSNH